MRKLTPFASLRTGALALAVVVPALAGCSGGPKSDIGLIDVQRITANWPKFQNYQNQLTADQIALSRSTQPANEKVRQEQQLEQRYGQAQAELTGEVQDAAKQVAAQKNLKLVMTRQFVGYGGVDITPDIEKVLNISEKATPKP